MESQRTEHGFAWTLNPCSELFLWDGHTQDLARTGSPQVLPIPSPLLKILQEKKKDKEI